MSMIRLLFRFLVPIIFTMGTYSLVLAEDDSQDNHSVIKKEGEELLFSNYNFNELELTLVRLTQFKGILESQIQELQTQTIDSYDDRLAYEYQLSDLREQLQLLNLHEQQIKAQLVELNAQLPQAHKGVTGEDAVREDNFTDENN